MLDKKLRKVVLHMFYKNWIQNLAGCTQRKLLDFNDRQS